MYPSTYDPITKTASFTNLKNGSASFRMWMFKGKLHIEIWTPDMPRRKEKDLETHVESTNDHVRKMYSKFMEWKNPDIKAPIWRNGKSIDVPFSEKLAVPIVNTKDLQEEPICIEFSYIEGLKSIFDLKKKFFTEPYSLHIPILKNDSSLKIEMIKWDGDKPNIIGHIKIQQADENLWEVEESQCAERGAGKLLYYLAMDCIYPAYLTPDFTGVSPDALRVYKALDLVSYVESSAITQKHKCTDVFNDGYYVINKMYRFKFPRFR